MKMKLYQLLTIHPMV